MKESTRKYSCIIVDDDFSSIGVLRHHISLIPKLKLVKSYLNPLIAAEQISQMDEIDILFLDINMTVSGIDIATLVRNKVNCIIFVTGHPESALEAFRVHADDFIVKPVSFVKFVSSINKVLSKASF